ncbi:hypothetical protein BgiBS90_035789 [Biomphalaria glabrata]|nr:hypothetical protein BgiBS90_035789 [Biomphalaria glabrata]
MHQGCSHSQYNEAVVTANVPRLQLQPMHQGLQLLYIQYTEAAVNQCTKAAVIANAPRLQSHPMYRGCSYSQCTKDCSYFTSNILRLRLVNALRLQL